jgi:hypothetical protein
MQTASKCYAPRDAISRVPPPSSMSSPPNTGRTRRRAGWPTGGEPHAFEMALASLRSTLHHADPVREVFARKIIALVQAGERDPERLCDGAVEDLPPAPVPPATPSAPT